MKEIVERGATSQIVHVFIPDSASTTGAGKTALAHDSAGLKIVVMRPGEASATKYLQSAGNIETITTIGTYQTPTADKCRFKEIDATDLPGWYELHFANALFDATSSRRSLGGMISGAAGVAPTPFQIQLSDPTRGVGSPVALPNAAAEAVGGLYTRGPGAGQINQPANGLIDVRIGNTVHTIQRLIISNNTADPAFHVLNSVGNAAKFETSADNMHAAVYEAGGANAFGISAAFTNTNLATAVDANNIMGRLGAPVGASLSADIAGIFARTDVATSTRMAEDADVHTMADRFLLMTQAAGGADWQFDVVALAQAPAGGGGGGGFAGAQSVTLRFRDAGNNPVPNVVFTVVGVGTGATDATGEITIGLNDGAYTITAVPTGGTMFADTPIVVAGDGTHTITGTAITIVPPADPLQSAGVLTTYDGNGDVVGEIGVQFRMKTGPGNDGASFPKMPFTETSDVDGLLQANFVRGATYEGSRDGGSWVSFTVPTNAASFNLPEILGKTAHV